VDPTAAEPLVFAFRGRDLVVLKGDPPRIPSTSGWPALGLVPVRENDAGTVDGRRCQAVELPGDDALPDGVLTMGLRAVWFALGESAFRQAGRAVQVMEWDRSHQFCGRCGGPTERVAGELARRCPRCGISFYPRLSPAIIVLVERGDEALLGRNARFPGVMYSTLAGFVEAGETLEEAVVREVREEAGIEVRDVRYFGSQPWPFPDSLMIGFTAQHASGEITPDHAEISDAAWYHADALPPVPPRLSIARQLIDAWVRRRGGDPDALEAPPLR
jgi:NAD+ diphosphatase